MNYIPLFRHFSQVAASFHCLGSCTLKPCRLHRFVRTSAVHNAKAKSRFLPFEMDINVAQDTVLYTHEKPRLVKILAIFGVSQCVFWSYMAQNVLTGLRDVKPQAPVADKNGNAQDIPFWRRVNLGENKYRYGLALLAGSIGFFLTLGSWLFVIRTVKKLVLLQGGKSIHITTYSPFKIPTVPLKQVSCQQHRAQVKSFLSLKVNGYWLYFLLEKNSNFPDPKLFDNSVGLYRDL